MLDEAISSAQAEARSDVSDTRRMAIIAMVVTVVIGSALLVLLSLGVSRSLIVPLRSLGRAMRRFGDGDLASRAAPAPDEVGTLARSFNSLADAVEHRVTDLRTQSERGSQLRVISEALDLAVDEPDVHRILEHALAILAPGTPGEVLAGEEQSLELRQVVTNPSASPPNCPVTDQAGCPAISRGRTVTFDGPDSLNACPNLRGRPGGPCSAVCVPMTAGGQTLGVLHATGRVGAPPPGELVDHLTSLVSQASVRIESIRILESTREQASTDTLTGLANRRILEVTLGDLLRRTTPFVLVVADLDHFKSINDQYGHEVGDRALRLFADVLADNVRDHDLVARFGGEEFVLVYPNMGLATSIEVIERIRIALHDRLERSDLPQFTSSYGVTHSSVADEVDEIIRVADAGLFMAKDLGRNRVVVSDADSAAEVFAEHSVTLERRRSRVERGEFEEPQSADPIDLVESPEQVGGEVIDLAAAASGGIDEPAGEGSSAEPHQGQADTDDPIRPDGIF